MSNIVQTSAGVIEMFFTLKVGTHDGTSSRMQGQVESCELAIFASKSSHRDQL